MGRARGKHDTGRTPPEITDQEDPQVRYIGGSPRTQGVPSPIPGGRPHLGNPSTVRHSVPVPEPRPEHRGMMAHGVLPDTHTTRERAEMERGPNHHEPLRPHYRAPAKDQPDPVPVYVVERGGGHKVIRSSAPRHIQLQASTGEAVRVCGANLGRVRIGLLNESTSSDIRFAVRPSDLTNGGGALLPWPSNSYVWLQTQDEMYAISADSGTPKLSIVEEFEQQW